MNLYTYVANNPLKFVDPSGHQYIEIGVVYSRGDRELIKAYQSLFATAKQQNNIEIMQAAHDAANLVRLQYEERVLRTDFSIPDGFSREYTTDMYNEMYYGNVRELGLWDDPMLMGIGFFTGAGGLKTGYTITQEAIEGVMKQWGKTTGKKAVSAFEKAANKGFVYSEGANGIKSLTGALERNGVKYTVELKVFE